MLSRVPTTGTDLGEISRFATLAASIGAVVLTALGW